MPRRLNGTPIREPTEKDVRQVRVKRMLKFTEALADEIEKLLRRSVVELNMAEFLLGSFYAVEIVYRKILKHSLERSGDVIE